MTHIYLDAGHGTQKSTGLDNGAIGIGGVKEAEINLAVAKYLQKELERCGVQVTMSRTTASTPITLNQRTREANALGVDYVISIHCNAWEQESANGTATYIYTYGGESEKLARKVQKEMLIAIPLRDRGVVAGNLAVVRDTKAPAILIELAFVTNKKDCAELVKDENQKAWAVAICKGVCEHINIKYKGETVVANKDNTPDKYAADAVKWAVDNGILKGNENGDYMLHSNVTRQDMLVFLYRALNK